MFAFRALFVALFETRDLINWPRHNLLARKVSRFSEGASPLSEPGRASARCCHGELGHFALIRTTRKYGLGVRRICRTRRRSGLKSITISQCRKQRPKGKTNTASSAPCRPPHQSKYCTPECSGDTAPATLHRPGSICRLRCTEHAAGAIVLTRGPPRAVLAACLLEPDPSLGIFSPLHCLRLENDPSTSHTLFLDSCPNTESFFPFSVIDAVGADTRAARTLHRQAFQQTRRVHGLCVHVAYTIPKKVQKNKNLHFLNCEEFLD